MKNTDFELAVKKLTRIKIIFSGYEVCHDESEFTWNLKGHLENAHARYKSGIIKTTPNRSK